MANTPKVNEPEILVFHGLPRKYKSQKKCPLGDKEIIRPNLFVDEKGVKKAEPGEKFDLDGYIQESAGSTDIASIVARLEAGDPTAIMPNPNAFYGDSVILPKDLYDVKGYEKVYQDAANNFAKLPEDVRALFGNDSTQFFNSVMNGQVNTIMAQYNKQKADAAAAAAAQGEGGAE